MLLYAAGAVALALVIFGVVIPKYLEFRRILGIEAKIKAEKRFWHRQWLRLSGLQAAITALMGIFFMGLPDLLEGLKVINYDDVFAHDVAKYVVIGLSFLTIIVHCYGNNFAARSMPVNQ